MGAGHGRGSALDQYKILKNLDIENGKETD